MSTTRTGANQARIPNKLTPANAQAKVFQILDKLSKGKNEKAYNMLYSIYRDASSTFFTRVELNEEDLEKSIEKQYKVILKNIRQGGEVNANRVNIDISNIDNKINFCLLMWLDMSHDGTLGDGMNFESFLQSSVLKTFLGENPTFSNNNGSLKNTELMIRMLNTKIIQKGKFKGKKEQRRFLEGLWPGNQFENKIKTNLPYLFDVKVPLVKTAEVVKLAALARNRENLPIYVSIDSESEKKTISKLIENAKYSFNSRNRGRIDRYFLKPLITLANRVDPGRLMPGKGVSEEFAKLMQKENKLKSTQLYNVKDCVCRVGKTRLTLTSGKKGTFKLTYGRGNNNINIPHGITAGQAVKSVSNTEKLSKFLGDFMQILIAATNNGKGPVAHRMVIGTLDGVMSGMTCFIFKNILGIEPRLFIDMSYKQANQVFMFGVDDLIKTGNGINKQRAQVVAESNIGSNIAPSPQSRPQNRRLNSVLEGSGNSTNTANSRKSTTSSGSKAVANMIMKSQGQNKIKRTPIQIRNSNSNSNNNMNNANRALTGMLGRIAPPQKQNRKRENNNNKNKNGPPPVRGPNTQSGVGSRNSMAGNRNKNLNNNASFSGNSQPNAKKPNANKPNNRSNLLAQIANLQARLSRSQAVAIETANAASAATNAAKAATKKLEETKNASNAQAAKNAAAKNAAANNAAKKAANQAKATATRLKTLQRQLRTNANLPGASPNQRPRKSKRQR